MRNCSAGHAHLRIGVRALEIAHLLPRALRAAVPVLTSALRVGRAGPFWALAAELCRLAHAPLRPRVRALPLAHLLPWALRAAMPILTSALRVSRAGPCWALAAELCRLAHAHLRPGVRALPLAHLLPWALRAAVPVLTSALRVGRAGILHLELVLRQGAPE